ncbi:MAG: alpha/beta hydrolase [Candidatus Kapabacteria bacterium]|nr:alpha/beta hydrolase [Candidatus Kapabacteria bacterium]
MRTTLIVILGLAIVLGVVVAVGPATPVPTLRAVMPHMPDDLGDLQQRIDAAERQYPVRPGLQAQILWADSVPSVTDVAIVYLHGFSGTWRDGSPAIERVAAELRANVFLARLPGHGLRTAEPLVDFHPDSVYAGAVRALAIGKRLGRRVVVVGTSTGATLGMMLAAAYPRDIAAIVNWSPNVRLAHPLSFLSNGPWGLALTKVILGGPYREVRTDDSARNAYWYMKYRAEAIPQLQALLEAGMTDETFAAIRQPTLTMCWYASDAAQDSLVSVPAMRTMHEQLAATSKAFVELDARNHEIGYAPESRAVDDVVRRTVEWSNLARTYNSLP